MPLANGAQCLCRMVAPSALSPEKWSACKVEGVGKVTLKGINKDVW